MFNCMLIALVCSAQTLYPLSRESIEWYMVPRGHILDMGVKIQGVNHGYTLELYTATYTGNSLYNARNRPIQQTRPVPRDCLAIQRVQRVQRAPIQPRYTFYSLYTMTNINKL